MEVVTSGVGMSGMAVSGPRNSIIRSMPTLSK